MYLSVVVPTYQQCAVIAHNVEVILGKLDRFGANLEVIVVIDGGDDDSATQLARITDSRLRVITYQPNKGKGHALKTGSQEARGRWIAWLDSDLDLDPSGIPLFVDTAELLDLDVVVGSKRHPDSEVDYPWLRRCYSALYQRLVQAMFGLNVRDTQVGIKLFRRDVLEAVLPVTLVKRFAFDIEILAVAYHFGYHRIAEGPVRLKYNFSGSRMDWAAIGRALWDTLAVFYRLRIRRYYDRTREGPPTASAE
jgi:glycosyltransferase involved in cell wall biosynthesis